VRMLPVRSLTRSQIAQVFADGSIRTEREQIAILVSPRPRCAAGRPATIGKVRVDRTTGLVHMGKTFAPYTDVIAALIQAGYDVVLRTT
jgi:hypothetical protein